MNKVRMGISSKNAIDWSPRTYTNVILPPSSDKRGSEAVQLILYPSSGGPLFALLIDQQTYFWWRSEPLIADLWTAPHFSAGFSFLMTVHSFWFVLKMDIFGQNHSHMRYSHFSYPATTLILNIMNPSLPIRCLFTWPRVVWAALICATRDGNCLGTKFIEKATESFELNFNFWWFTR